MKNSLETKLGFFVFLAIVAAWMIVETLGGVDFFTKGYHVNALFVTVQDLKVGDSVKMAGVEIGRVEKISLTQSRVNVVMKIHPDAVIKTDSTATVKFTGLMGQNYVEISFGSPSAPAVGDNTTLVSTEEPDLNAIMAKLDSAASGIQNLTKSFTPDTINNLMGPLVDFVKQNSQPLTATIANIKNVSSQIAAGQGTIGKMIYDETLYDSALNTVSNMQGAVTQVRQVVSKVSSGQGTLGKLMTDPALFNSTESSMTNLNEILLKINQGQGTVGKLVNDQEFYKNAKLSLQKLDKATDSLEDTGPLSVIGIMANNLF